MIRTTLLLGSALALAAVIPSVAAGAAPAVDSAAISGLGIRNIGSAAMSGRIAALAARTEANGKVTLFVGAASGGVWKSEDGGTTFKPVFDKQPVQSIGALALDPTNPKVVWAGTGEAWTRNSVSIGDGIYKSTDGGETWTNMGLPKSERITSIVVHPTNGDIVYACAPGALWSDSPDRGLYKTTDGGKTWSHILKGSNLSTGCSTIALDPSNPDMLMAGLWDFRRKGWSFRSGGDGPDAPSGSALLRSADGGRTWSKMTAENTKGLPKGPWGRIEVAYAPSNPKQIYTFIENVRSALYVSEDGGRTFEERDRSQGMVWRPFYFAKIVVDPKNDKRLFKMNLPLIVSDDGGKSFSSTANNAHGDWHDVWINPTNPQHIIGGDDGGLWTSFDGGNRWEKSDNLPLSQFYHVAVDDKDPYQVYGGLQDNGSWIGDSAYPGGIHNGRWELVYYGDGFWVLPDPNDPNIVYAEYQGGNVGRIDRRTLQGRDIQPKAGYKEKMRYNWNTPIHVTKNALYIGSQFLFRSRDKGVTWERISPDLTTNDPAKQRQEESGGITVDNSAAEMHTTIFSISESPMAPDTVWVGTDDGNVQLTRDGGKSWTNLTRNLKGLPKGTWISSIEASRHDAATAYVTVDRHMWGDMAPHVFKTSDYGRTWKRLAGPSTAGLRGYAHVVKEDMVDPKLLFVGTELGLSVSTDGGANWAEFKPNGFPAVAVRDIALQKRDHDLVLATHGRGIWVVDDISPLRALKPDMLAAGARLIPGRPIQQRMASGLGSYAPGDAKFFGDNPPGGAVINYYQPTRHVIGRMKLEVLDAQGNLVDTLPASKRKGLNRVEWSMRLKPPQVPPAASLAFFSTQGPRVLPGQYTVRLTKGDQVTTMPLTIGLDRRAEYTPADRQAQFAAAQRVSGMFGRMSALNAKLQAVKAGADDRSTKLSGADKARAAKLSAEADRLRKLLVATKEGGAITGEERLREHLDAAYGAVSSTEHAPSPYQIARIDALDRELREVEEAFAKLDTGEVQAFNRTLERQGLAAIDPQAIKAATSDARGGNAAALAAGLVGNRFVGSFATFSGQRD